MKNKTFLMLLVVALLITSVGTVGVFGLSEPSSANAPVPTVPTAAATVPSVSTTVPTIEATKPVLHLRVPLFGLQPDPGSKWPYKLVEFYDLLGTRDEAVALDIPVYDEWSIFFQTQTDYDLYWTLRCKGSSLWDPSINFIFRYLPTTALRVRPDNTSYLVYDSETGYRLYLFMDPKTNHITGWPIVVDKSKIPTLRDFSNLQIGDSIETLFVIDGVAELIYKGRLRRQFEGRTQETWELIIKNSRQPPYTYHYCKDGILRIEYDVVETSEGMDMIISNIICYEDFVVEDCDDKLVNKKILDIDLPLN